MGGYLIRPMDLFALSRTLIDVDSTTGREAALGDLLARHLQRLAEESGGTVERMQVEGDRFNVFAAWGEPVVVLSTHYDTVPPFFPSSEDDEVIRGRGACDTKGGIAAMLTAAQELLAEGRRGFGLLFVVGEETDSVGARVANANPRGSRFLVNGEPTENRLALGSKGCLNLVVEAKGRAAHSAYPELGSSAIDKLLAALAGLRQVPLPTDPVLGESTLNIGTLSGGRAANVIADFAKAEVMVRTVGDTLQLKYDLLTAVAMIPDADVTSLRETPAVHMEALPGFATTVVKYTTDVPHLTAWGRPFLLGPGTIHVAHTPEERVAKAELVAAVGLYKEVAYRLWA